MEHSIYTTKPSSAVGEYMNVVCLRGKEGAALMPRWILSGTRVNEIMHEIASTIDMTEDEAMKTRLGRDTGLS